MPTVLQNGVTGDSLCLDTASQGNAETYVVQDVVTAVDTKLRTMVDPKSRGIGGLSMGGYCALNLGLKHPDLFSVVLDFSGDTSPVTDTLPGGLPASVRRELAAAGRRQQPSKYCTQLDGKKGPAIWMDCGTGDPDPPQMQALAAQLKSKGFTVEFHSAPAPTTSRLDRRASRTRSPGRRRSSASTP